jgi:hypothetical protein
MTRKPYIDQPSHNPAYVGAKITDVRRGTGARSCYVYANLRDPDGHILISATVDYIMNVLEERVSPQQMDDFDRQLKEIGEV